jgi:hypothetical protein
MWDCFPETWFSTLLYVDTPKSLRCGTGKCWYSSCQQRKPHCSSQMSFTKPAFPQFILSDQVEGNKFFRWTHPIPHHYIDHPPLLPSSDWFSTAHSVVIVMSSDLIFMLLLHLWNHNNVLDLPTNTTMWQTAVCTNMIKNGKGVFSLLMTITLGCPEQY